MLTLVSQPSYSGAKRNAFLELTARIAQRWMPTFLLAVHLVLGDTSWSAELSFSRDIRPIFSNKCSTCHGPDEQTREGGFRLDIKQSAFSPADSGETPIVPGDLAASEVWRRINLHESDDVMPPADQERQLTPADVELVKAWIEQGAKWEEHWAFVNPIRPELLPVKAQRRVNNPIDALVLKKLEAMGRTFSSPADKSTLIRRVTFDLTGLPPTLEEVDQFLADTSSNAYAELVERLLASPHFGEHMASQWLDAARYADTNGYQNDFSRQMWPWRDWVIKALNANMPYDEFTIQQLAGDLLPNATGDQIIATGFNRNNRTVTEAGSIDEEWLVENVIDRVETTSTAFLGLTAGCARCHDHKYDPISQREFYQLFAYFNNVDELGVYTEKRGNAGPVHFVLTAEQQTIQDEWDERRAIVEADVERLQADLPEQQAQWEKSFANESPVLAPADEKLRVAVDANPNTTTRLQSAINAQLADTVQNGVFSSAVRFDGDEHDVIDLGDAFSFDAARPFSGSVWAFAEENGVILSRMDEKDDARGFDWVILDDGRVAIHFIHKYPKDALKIITEEKIETGKWNHISFVYDGSRKAAGFQVYLNSQRANIDPEIDALQGETTTDHPLWLGDRTNLTRLKGQLAELRLFDRALARDELVDIFRASLHHIRSIPPSDRSEDQTSLLTRIYRLHFAEAYGSARLSLATLDQEQREFRKDLPTVMVMKERSEPRETFVLLRGVYDKPDKERQVFPATPAFLPQPDEGWPSNRLGLARWIVSPDNPLTARVAVNRLWLHVFGRGLVDSTENFGVQCPPPEQAELLDWLAVEFVERGWDMKAMLRLIVNSSTYQQSSDFSPRSLALDRENQYLGRGSRYRLPSEAIRDNALAVSGLLMDKIGGPSIKPYQPEGVWEELAGGAGEGPYVQDKNEQLYRRSLYIYRKRTVPHPTMATFDAPSRDICQVARQRTNTPLQALALLNDVTYIEAARQLAILAMERGGSSADDRLTYAFRRATCRPPNERELAILVRSLERSQQQFALDPEAAKQYTQIGESQPPGTIDSVQLAAFTHVASTILNLDETITKE